MRAHERLERERQQTSQQGEPVPEAGETSSRDAPPAGAWQTLLGAMQVLDEPGDGVDGSAAGRDTQPAKKKRRSRGGSRGHGKWEYRYEDPTRGGPDDNEWKRSGADIRAAWNALEAQGSRAQPIPQLRARNLPERFTALLHVLDTTGVGLQAPWDYMSPGSTSREAGPELPALNEPSGPAAQEPEEDPGASAAEATRPNYEYIALSVMGATAAAAHQTGGATLAERMADMLAAGAASANQAARHPVSKAIGATALLAGLTYAWYSMFARSGTPAAAEREAEAPGALTADERAMLDSIVYPRAAFERASAPGTSGKPPLEPPFNASEISELEQISKEFEDLSGDLKDETQPFPGATTQPGRFVAPAMPGPRGFRAKRSLADEPKPTATPAAATSTAATSAAPARNQEYWERKYEAAADDSPEKPILALLKAGPQPSGKYSLAAPRESFPMGDAWYTRMDQFDVGVFTNAFLGHLLTKSIDASRSPKVKHPDAGLPEQTWLHLGRYYELLYHKILHGWSRALLRLDEPVSSEYALASGQIKKLVEKLNADWEGSAFDATVLHQITQNAESLEQFHAKMVKFFKLANDRIADALEGDNWEYNPELPAKELLWSPSNLFYLENIDISEFTTGFLAELKEFMSSHVLYQIDLLGGDAGGTKLMDIHIVIFFTDMSLIATRRIVEAIEGGDLERAYNYAVLDEQLTQIIVENITPLCRKPALLGYLESYNFEREKVLPAFNKMIERMEKERSDKEIFPQVETTSTSTTLGTEDGSTGSVQNPVANANWEEIWKYVEDADPLPEERINAGKYVQDILRKKLTDTVDKIIDFLQERILDPERYIRDWVSYTLLEHDQRDEWSPNSVVAAYIGFAREELFYTLAEIARGEHRRHPLATKSAIEIDWPPGFSSALRDRLEFGLSGDIDLELESVFDTNRATLSEITRVMASRAALSYVAQKSRATEPLGESEGFYHKAFLDAVKRYLEGKITPDLILWHDIPVSGLIFIPIEMPYEGHSTPGTVGVILSIWSGTYYEIPWPGFANPQTRRWDGGSGWRYTDVYLNPEGWADLFLPDVNVEKATEFKDFMEKHRTPTIGRRLEKIPDAFAYTGRVTQLKIAFFGFEDAVGTIDYTPPFSTVKYQDHVDALIDLQREELNVVYDYLISSEAELGRATIQELFNTLSIVAGVLLMGGGILFGGPAWAWVLASLTSTLLLDVTPNAVLYSQADDQDERDLYLRSLTTAIAFELFGNAVSEAAAPLLKSAAYRVARLGSTAFRTTLPQWYKFARERMGQVVARLKVEPVRKIGDNAGALSKGVKKDLDRAIEDLSANEESKVAGNIDAPPQASGAAASNPLDVVLSRLNVEKLNRELVKAANKLKESNFEVWFRVVSRWARATDTNVQNEFVIVARREGETAIVTPMREKGKSAYIYQEEGKWLRDLHDKAIAGEMVIKYLDYSDFRAIQYAYSPISDYSGKIASDSYIEGAYVVSPPEGYKNAIKARTGMAYEDIQVALGKVIDDTGDAGVESARPVSGINTPTDTKRLGRDNGDSGQLRISEPFRKIPPRTGDISNFTTDFEAEEILKKLEAVKEIAEAVAEPWGKCDRILVQVANVLTTEGFTNIRYRGMFLWINAIRDRSNHYVVIATKDGVDYVFDLTAGQFSYTMKGLSGPLIMREEDWAAKYSGSTNRRLIKYKDFDDASSAKNVFNSPIQKPDEFIEDATILTMPRWYLALINAKVETQAKIPNTALSEKIRLRAEDANWMNFELQHPPKLDPDIDDPKAYKLAKQAKSLKKLGPDIKEFYPIPENLGMKHLDQEGRNQIVEAYSDLRGMDSQFERVGDDIVTVSLATEYAQAERAAARNVEDSFGKAMNAAEKVLAVMVKAEEIPEILDYVIGILARFLNTKNIDILSEAYKRLKEIARRTYDMAYFHYADQELGRVIPLRIRPGQVDESKIEAFVYPYDPASRIFVVLDNFSEWTGAETLTHELTHLSSGTLDFQYLESGSPLGGVPGTRAAHSMFGSTLFDEYGLQFGIGRYQLGAKGTPDSNTAPLTDQEIVLAQARSTRLPMLSANAKMNNADSIVVLYNAILDAFSIKRVEDFGMESGAWLVTRAATRNRRSIPEQSGQNDTATNTTATNTTAPPEDITPYSILGLYSAANNHEYSKFWSLEEKSGYININNIIEKQRSESILSSLIVAGSHTKKEDILSAQELEDYDFYF